MLRIPLLFVVLSVLVAGEDRPLLAPDAVLSVQPKLAGPAKASAQMVDVLGQTFARALRVTVETVGLRFWEVEAILPLADRLAKGETARLVLSLRAMTTDGGPGRATVYVQRHGDPWTKSLMREVVLGPQWTELVLPLRSAEDYAAGEAAVVVGLAQREQIVEIGGVSFIALGQADPGPGTPFTYHGREAGAAWRTAAEERIARIRTAPLTVRVRDRAGRPVFGATVRARQSRSAFGFGTAVNAALLTAAGADAER